MRTFRCPKYLVAAILISTSLISSAQITIVGTADCGSWVSSRKANNQLMQEWLLGLFNGLAFGANMELWDANGQTITHQQMYLWMDNYCTKNPLNSVLQGSVELMNERTNGRFSKRSLNKQ
jgi:hypothetical protein